MGLRMFLNLQDYIYGYNHKINPMHIMDIQFPYNDHCHIKLTNGDVIDVKCTEEEIDKVINKYL